ncbi:hypothetical protein BGZ94_009714, partial [Podila epigama]
MPTAPSPSSLPQVSFVNLYSEDPWKKRQRVRIQQACSDCRRQKIKCDGQRPCKACQKAERTCVYAAGPTHHPHPPGASSSSASTSSSPATSTSVSTTTTAAASAASSHTHTPTCSTTPTPGSSRDAGGSTTSSKAATASGKNSASRDDHHDFKVKQEPDESRVPPPLRRDSKHHHHGHGHGHEDVKIQIKDIGKYGIPLDEWQKDDSASSSLHPSQNTSRKS